MGGSQQSKVIERSKKTLEIEISYNELSAIPAGALAIKGLKRAVFAGNKLSSLSPQIRNWTQMSILELDGNQIKALPKEIGSLRALTKLNIGFNKLESLPNELAQCTSITSLNVGHNSLVVMFPGIGSLTAMVELDFSHNKLETLPDTLAQLKQMTKIEAHHNLFYRIPHVLTQLTEIDQLNLQECEIKTLDVSVVHAFSQLPNLKILDLSRNKLTSLPSETIDLFTLREFHLDHNPIKEFPDRVQSMHNLKFNWHDWQDTLGK